MVQLLPPIPQIHYTDTMFQLHQDAGTETKQLFGSIGVEKRRRNFCFLGFAGDRYLGLNPLHAYKFLFVIQRIPVDYALEQIAQVNIFDITFLFLSNSVLKQSLYVTLIITNIPKYVQICNLIKHKGIIMWIIHSDNLSKKNQVIAEHGQGPFFPLQIDTSLSYLACV